MIEVIKPPMWCPGIVPAGHPLRRGLISNHPIWIGSGPTLMDVCGVNPATITGAPDWGETPMGWGLRADDDQYATFAHKATDYFTNKFSVVWWGSPVQSMVARRYFFVGQYRDDGAQYDWGLYIGSSPFRVSFFTRTGGTVNVTSTSGLSVGIQTMIVGTYDGANMRIYFDGRLEDTDAQTGNVAGTYAFHLGYLYNNTYYADMRTTGLALYNRDLAASEVEWLYREPWVLNTMRDNLPAWVGATMGEEAPAGLSIPIAMHHYKQMMGVN